jgi:uncharacterized protein (TIGR02421 family)
MDDHPPAPSARQPGTAYERAVRELSDRLVEAQRPIRVLDAVKWDDTVERGFFAAGGQKPPPVTPDYYARRPLPFDPSHKRDQLNAIARDVRKRLGTADAPGRILVRMCAEYMAVVEMIAARGTPKFVALSRQLYGTTQAGTTPSRLAWIVACLPLRVDEPEAAPALDSAAALQVLAARLANYFGTPAAVRLKLSDGILADAAAGSDYLKLRRNARFTPAELRLLEVHEGWVHLGTTLAGQAQPVCTFLAKGPPSSTRTQEGLAVLMEFLTGTTHPARLRRLRRRLEGVALAESGADFLDVYRRFVSAGDAPAEAYQQAARIFRGSLPAGVGAFTKDLCYCDGLLEVARYCWTALARRDVAGPAALFCGKTAVEDAPALAELAAAGLVRPARFVPAVVADTERLADRLTDLPFLHALSAPALAAPSKRRGPHLPAARAAVRGGVREKRSPPARG